LSIYSFEVLAAGAEDVNGSRNSFRKAITWFGICVIEKKQKKKVQINSILLAHDESVDCSPVIAW
jgi:hypothetical protein